MSPFVNKRIESPFQETYKGYNQYIYTGGIDDLFLMDSATNVSRPRLRRIAGAFADYGSKAAYDIVVTVKEDLSLVFATDEQRRLFDSIANGSSESLVPSGRKARAFVPRANRSSGQTEPGGGSAAGNTASAQTPENAPQQSAAERATEDVSRRTQGSDALNRLGKITRVLKDRSRRTLVIFPHPERIVSGGEADGNAVQKIEVIVKDWRDIVQEANPDTRTILIVNPHRLKEFHLLERTISCFDHNCREITIPPPPVDEMKAWLRQYKILNNISGTSREEERVVLTGKANAGGNLQNFVSWVQSFYQKNVGCRAWKELLARENQDAVESKEDLLEELDRMIGLTEVKREIHSIVENVEKNGAVAADAAYHMFFLGNPGTGKTVVANIVAKLFWAMELRTNRNVVSVAIQDIISQYNEGETLQKMKDKIQEAMGGVLFIDEAYLFAESDWGRKAFQSLLTEMENNRKNLTVILAGYENRLQALKDINPGIDSRIPYKLHFGDYSKDEKLGIFKLHLANAGKKTGLRQVLSPEAEVKLLRILDECEGNGRGVRNILEKTLKESEGAELILPEHITDSHAIHEDEAYAVLSEIDENFIGMRGLKDRLRKYFRRVKWNIERCRALGLTRRTGMAYRIRFTGPPGTGKTSVARYMGRFFKSMGICETDECKECGATSLKGAYIGHAQKAVNNLFHENRGKVLFIDEIYSLYNPEAHQDDSFSREVIDTLVRCLTAEEYQNTVVIVAGYKDRVDKFMEANPGLASRIPEEILFEDYTANDCVDIFESLAKKDAYELTEGCREKLIRVFENLKQDENFGNARTVNGVFGAVVGRLIDRLADAPERSHDDFTKIMPVDIPGDDEGPENHDILASDNNEIEGENK